MTADPRLPASRTVIPVVLALVACSGAALTVDAAGSGVHKVLFDRVEDVPASEFTFAPCGDTGDFVPVDGGFRFEERQPGTSEVGGTPYPGGYLAIGCGVATVDRQPPAGATLVEVAFQGDRGVDEFNVDGNYLRRPGREFSQDVELRTVNGTGDRRVAYMDPGAGSLPLQPVTLDAFQVPSGAGYTLAWVFRDASYFVGPDFPDVLSGQAFSATVAQVQLRYPGLPAAYQADDDLAREGRLIVDKTRVHIPVAPADVGTGDVRLEVASGLAFDHLTGPDGRRIERAGTRATDGPNGFDRSGVLAETLADGSTQVIVPREVVSSMGAGRYTVAFTNVHAVHTYPWLLPVAFLLLLAPMPFALLAYHHVRRFEHEAFGGFRRSARNLRVALVVAFAYYLAVIASHFAASRFELMTAWPLPFEAILLYVQVAIAVVAFLALYAVANELYHITVPKALPDAAPQASPVPEDLE